MLAGQCRSNICSLKQKTNSCTLKEPLGLSWGLLDVVTFAVAEASREMCREIWKRGGLPDTALRPTPSGKTHQAREAQDLSPEASEASEEPAHGTAGLPGKSLRPPPTTHAVPRGLLWVPGIKHYFQECLLSLLSSPHSQPPWVNLVSPRGASPGLVGVCLVCTPLLPRAGAAFEGVSCAISFCLPDSPNSPESAPVCTFAWQ